MSSAHAGSTRSAGNASGGRKPRRWLRWLAIGAVLALAFNFFFGSSPGPEVADGSALVVKLEGQYLEAPQAPLFSRLLGEKRQPFLSALQALRLAELDDRIDTVVLRVRPLGLGWGKAQELRAAIEAVRAAGRKTVAVLELQGISAHREYFVASAADRVLLHPSAIVPIVGLAAEYMHLGAFFEKLGVDFEVAKAGRYKSAVEFFAEEKMSGPAREMVDSMLDSISTQFIAGVAESRGVEPARVRSAIEAGAIFPAELEGFGLTDGRGTVDELLADFESVVEGADYLGTDPAILGFEEQARFALVYASGNVVVGKGERTTGGDPVMASDSLAKALEEAADDAEIAAIVVRVDSPGGSALASEMIWQAVEKAREHSHKPIVVSFSDVAASGGYYVSAGADAIVSNGATLTGSIGVFLLRPELSKTYEKLGIGVEPFTRGPHADLALASRPLSEGTRRRFDALATDTYRLFLERVAAGRRLEVGRVDQVAQGRVWTGEQALEAGLVDRIGGLRTAVDLAKEMVGLEADAGVVLTPFPAPPTLAEQLAEALGMQIATALRERLPLPGETGALAPLGRLGAHVRSWSGLPSGTPLAVLPIALDVH